MKRLLLPLMVLAAVAAGCGDDASGPVDPSGAADGTAPDEPVPLGDWLLVDSSTPSGSVPLVAGYDITLTFREGEVGGRAACNSYFGTIQTIAAGAWSVDGYGMTEMGCPEPGVHESEQAYLDALAVIDSYDHRDDDLVLSGPGTELRFALVAPVEDLPLVDTSWSLDTLIEGDAASNIAGMDAATIAFATDGTVTGFSGCNEFSAGYTLDGATLQLGSVERTEIACPGPNPETQVFAVLDLGDVRYSIEGDRLTIRSPDGQAGLVYRASS